MMELCRLRCIILGMGERIMGESLFNLTINNLMPVVWEGENDKKNYAIASAKVGNEIHYFFAGSGTNHRFKWKKLEHALKNWGVDKSITLCPDLTKEGLEIVPVERWKANGKDTYRVNDELFQEKGVRESEKSIRKKLYDEMLKYAVQRENCTERKILLEIYKKFEYKTINSNIELYTQLPPCHECSVLINKFRNEYLGEGFQLLVHDFSQLLHEKKEVKPEVSATERLKKYGLDGLVEDVKILQKEVEALKELIKGKEE